MIAVMLCDFMECKHLCFYTGWDIAFHIIVTQNCQNGRKRGFIIVWHKICQFFSESAAPKGRPKQKLKI